MVFSQNNVTSIIIEDKEYNIQSISFMGTEAEWSTNSDYIPKAGELVIYAPDEKISSYRLKIGDGTKKIVELTLNYIETAAEREELLRIIENHTNRIESTAQDITDLKEEFGEIKNSFDEVVAEKEEIQAVVEEHTNKIENVTKDVEDLKEEFLESGDNFNNALSKKADTIQHADGEVITLDDAAYTPVKGLKLYGKTTQNGTPTPEVPVELVSAGASGAIKTTVCGKNLFVPYVQSETRNGITVTVDKDGIITINGTSTANTWVGVGYLPPAGKFAFTPNWGGDRKDSIFSMVPNADEKYVYVHGSEVVFEKDNNEEKMIGLIVFAGTYSNLTIKPMIRSASVTDATYEPCKPAQTLTVSTPNGLPGIPVSSGGNYTDESGQAWVCDEIDFARGVYVQRIAQYTFTGAENWITFGSAGVAFFNRDYTVQKNVNYDTASNILCNRLDATTHIRCMQGTDVNSICLSCDNVGIGVCVEGVTSVDALRAWLAENPLDVLCVLAAPIETALSAEELAAYAALHSNKPNTTVYNDASAYMKMDYYTPLTAVQMVHSPADEGKVLSIDQHGCVVLTDLATRIARIESQLAYMAIITNNEEMLEV